MLKSLSAWLDSRTGYKAILHEALDEPIAGGARWRYVFGSALTAAFGIQLVTGLLLMTSYVPSSAHAWGSVWYINEQMAAGWIIRGVHHFGSQAMIVLLAMHLIQVLIAGAYRAPREVNWWFGMALLFITLGFSLTGYLLPWDQKGYWATKVATNILGGTPGLGPYLQRVVVGGTEYGNQTLTRFYGLHVGLLPALLVMCLAAHVALFRKHGVTAPKSDRPAETFWPKQVFMDTVASAAVLGVLLLMVFAMGGANLDAPADPAGADYPARPEWYFLSLFQMLKLPAFAGEREVIGTMVIPAVLVTVLMLLPLLDKVLPRGLAHFLACAFVFAVLGGAAYFTIDALYEDANSFSYAESRTKADRARLRALQLAAAPESGVVPAALVDAPEIGIPPDGAAFMLRRDPLTHGGRLMEEKCLACHYHGGQGLVARVEAEVDPLDLTYVTPLAIGDAPEPVRKAAAAKVPGFVATTVEPVLRDGVPASYRFDGKNGAGEEVEAVVSADATTVLLTTRSVQTAADLAGFGTKPWLRGLLADPSSPTYFGRVPQDKGMKSWKKDSKLTDDQLDQIADFFAEHVINVPEGTDPSTWEEAEAVQKHPGYAAFNEECATCHVFGDGGEAPNLFAWGSPAWTRRMIEHPGAADLYGYLEPADQMPPFAGRLTDADLSALVRYLHGDYLPPPGPPAAVPATPTEGVAAAIDGPR